MSNYSAKEFVNFKKRNLGRIPLGNQKKKSGKCKECGNTKRRMVKGFCDLCYQNKRAEEKREKRRNVF